MLARRQLLRAALGSSLAGLAGCRPPWPGPGPTEPGTPSPTPRQFLGVFPEAPRPTPTPAPPVVIRFAHWETGPSARALAAIASRFSQHRPRTVVQIEVTPFAVHFARLRQALATGQPPDVFVGSGVYGESALGPGALLDLSDLTTSARLDLGAYWTDPLTSPSQGGLYRLPLWTSAEVAYINRDHLAQAGLPEPAVDWTWGDLLRLARGLTVGKPGETTRWGLLLINDLIGGWGSFVASNGGRWLDPSGPRTTLDDGPTRETLQWLVDAVVVHHVAPSPSEQQRLGQAGQVDLFLGGQIAIFPNGTWEMPAALTSAAFQWDVRRLPRAPRTGQSISLTSVQPGSIARATVHPADAWDFLAFLLSTEAQRMLANGKVKLPALKSVASDAQTGYAAPPPAHAAAPVDALLGAHSLDFVPGWQDWRAAVVEALTPAFDGRVPLADALRQANALGDAALSRAGSPATAGRSVLRGFSRS